MRSRGDKKGGLWEVIAKGTETASIDPGDDGDGASCHALVLLRPEHNSLPKIIPGGFPCDGLI